MGGGESKGGRARGGGQRQQRTVHVSFSFFTPSPLLFFFPFLVFLLLLNSPFSSSFSKFLVGQLPESVCDVPATFEKKKTEWPSRDSGNPAAWTFVPPPRRPSNWRVAVLFTVVQACIQLTKTDYHRVQENYV